MGLSGRRITQGNFWNSFAFLGTFTSTSCKRYYPSSYKISGITRPGYTYYNQNVGAWIPYTIDNLIVSNPGGCINPVQMTWSAFDDSGTNIRLTYLAVNNGWAGGYDIPDSSWVIYQASAYVYTTIAYARGSRWSPPRSGYVTRNSFAGTPTVK